MLRRATQLRRVLLRSLDVRFQHVKLTFRLKALATISSYPQQPLSSKGIPTSHTGGAALRSFPLLRLGLLLYLSKVQTILVFPPSVFCYTHHLPTQQHTSRLCIIARTFNADRANMIPRYDGGRKSVISLYHYLHG